MVREFAEHVNRLVEKWVENKSRSLNDLGKPFRRCCRKRNFSQIVLDLHFKHRNLTDIPSHLFGVQQVLESWRKMCGVELRPQQDVSIEENVPHAP